jgi:hypothetical protein
VTAGDHLRVADFGSLGRRARLGDDVSIGVGSRIEVAVVVPTA